MEEKIAEPISATLAADDYQQKRREFGARFGRRFEGFLTEAKAAVAALGAGHAYLPLYVFDALPIPLRVQLNELAAAERGQVAKELVALHLDELPRMLGGSDLPDAIRALYPEVVAYMVRSIVDDDDAAYGDVRASYFDRDLRMAAGLSIPAGAQILDLRVAAPPSFYRDHGMRENLRCLRFITLRLGGLGPLVRIHTDSRNLRDFNENGWNACYERIALLLARRPEVRGMIGTSWFYDPQLQEVSPKLAYLARVPLENGAFLRIDGPGEIHTRRAIERSPTRKQLFADGAYTPTCATLIWPRKNLLAWATKQQTTC